MRKLLITGIVLTSLLHVEIASAERRLPPTSSNTVPEQEIYNPTSYSLSVSFKNGSTVFKPNEFQAADLDDASLADLIVIKGRTSTVKSSKKDEALALSRAISARNYLINKNVSPLNIVINYASAIDYRTENKTKLGKLENQRVDIDLIYIE